MRKKYRSIIVKLLVFILSVTNIFSMGTIVFADTKETTVTMYGDVNGDSYVTAEDALSVLQNVVWLVTLKNEQMVAADVDSDGSVSAEDALMILKYVVHFIDKFPAENKSDIPVAPTDVPDIEVSETMIPVENEETVVNNGVLRASTYLMTSSSTDESGATTQNTATIKYFPSTLYDYHTAAINNATQALEVSNALSGGQQVERWNGLYFTYGNPTWDFQYPGNLLTRTYLNRNSSDAFVEDVEITSEEEFRLWKTNHKNTNPFFYLDTTKMNVYDAALNGNKIEMESGYYEIWYASSTCIQFGKSNTAVYYMPDIPGTVFTEDLDEDGTAGLQLYAGNSTSADFAGWNYMTGSITAENLMGSPWDEDGWQRPLSQKEQSMIAAFAQAPHPHQASFMGLVKESLDRNKQIQFNIPAVDLFGVQSDDTKTVYTNVGIPFEYNPATQTYLFDSGQFAATFALDESGKVNAQSNVNLEYHAEPQILKHRQFVNPSAGDGIVSDTTVDKTSWYPFNDYNRELYCLAGGKDTSYGERQIANHHFGMNLTIPFTMTGNGRMDELDNNSEPIHFEFSGDDDVWIFIDGIRVADLGGIHENVEVSINFAENTITYGHKSVGETADGTGYQLVTEFHNIFDDILVEDGEQKQLDGQLNMTRETFSAYGEHELTIFYLERGGAYSDIKVEFNLPMRDFVYVTKNVQDTYAGENGGSVPSSEMEKIHGVGFGFILYEQNGRTVTPKANSFYSVLNESGQLIDTAYTDSSGHFRLHNGQTARFQVSIDNEISYYVVEDAKDGFESPTYSYDGVSAGGYSYEADSGVVTVTKGREIPMHTGISTNDGNLTTIGYMSEVVTVKGSSEAEDTLHINCMNQLTDPLLLNPDWIVIDYGLPVDIDVLANDVIPIEEGESVQIRVNTGSSIKYGATQVHNNVIRYTLNQQLNHVEKIVYDVYKVSASGTETYVGSSNVYISPATVMYYEEDFHGLITYGTKTVKEVIGISSNNIQEPGVVGTVGDSVYGSDVSYIDDSGDSNGTSTMLNVYNQTGAFTYTFTGTGTSFFARTDHDAATMRVRIFEQLDVSQLSYREDGSIIAPDHTINVLNVSKDEEGNIIAAEALVYEVMRDNRYVSTEGTQVGEPLYNIPVFTWQTSDVPACAEYGSYRVEVGLVKGTDRNGLGKSLYLDGVRVMNPLDKSKDGTDNEYQNNKGIGELCYAADGESGMTYATLRDRILPANSLDGDFNLRWDGEHFLVFTDSNGKITTAEEYKSAGPKEEVYLYDGQSVSFFLKDWDVNAQTVHLGMKAPTGYGKVNINGQELIINNTTDCYYDISKYVEIKHLKEKVEGNIVNHEVAVFNIQEANGGLISLTNIKATGNAQFTILREDQETTYGSVTVQLNCNESITSNWKIGLYEDENCTSLVAKGEAATGGSCTFQQIPIGTYYLKIIENVDANVSEMYEAEVVTVQVTEEGTTAIINPVKRTGSLTINVKAEGKDTTAMPALQYQIAVGRFVLDATMPAGVSSMVIDDIPHGEVTVTALTEETDDYKLASGEKTKTVSLDVDEMETVIFNYSERLPAHKTGTVTVAITGDSNGRSGWSLPLYSDAFCTTIAATLTTGTDGTASVAEIPYGTYYLGAPVNSNSGYAINQTFPMEVQVNAETNVVSLNVVKTTGTVTLAFTGAEETLEGWVFGLYSDGKQVATFTTDANGAASVANIPNGSYTVELVSKPQTVTKEYSLVVNPSTVTVNGNTAAVSVVATKVEGTTLVLKLVNSLGEPYTFTDKNINDTAMQLVGPNYAHYNVRPDNAGVITVTGITEGTYTLYIYNLWSDNNSLFFENGESRQIVVTSGYNVETVVLKLRTY